MSELIIKKLTIHNSDRFPLSEATHIEYTPEQPIQFILGTNGSGKSTLMKMLALTPKDIKNDFYDGGYCILELTYNGSNYTLKSGVEGPSKYNFIKDGVELNNGKTKTVYVSLIEQHFQLNAQIYKLMFNEVTFTRMSSNLRKEWFSRMSSISYDYAYQAYNEMKSRLRDLKGVKKMLQEKVAKIEATITNENTIQELEQDIAYIDTYINELNRFYLKCNDKAKPNPETIKEYTNALLRYSSKLKDEQTKPIAELETEIRHMEQLTKLKQREMVDLHERIEKNIANEKAYIEKLETTLEEKIHRYIEYFTLPKLIVYRQKLASLSGDISDMLFQYNTLVSQKDVVNFDEKHFTALSIKIKEVEYAIQQVDLHLQHFEDRLKSDEITCPSCQHRFKDGYDETEHRLLITKKERLVGQLDMLTKEYDSLLPTYNLYRDYIHVKEHLFTFFKPISDIIADIISNNTYLPQDVRALLLDINEIDTIIRIDSELRHIKETHSNDNVMDTSELNTLLEKSKKEFLAYSTEVTNLKKELIKAKEQDKAIREIDNTYTTLYNLLKENREYYLEQAWKEINSYITKDIQAMREHRDYFNLRLEKEKQTQYELNTATKDLEDTIQSMLVIQKAMDALSPKDGLIAESVRSFIGFILEKVTEIVNEIWTYPLSIELPVSESLDYKFAVRVSPTKVSPDIADTSDGMQEVIDLAFKVVTLKMLGFSNYPIFLDEFGRGFDPVHKSNVFKFIEKLSDLWFSQVFVVSHFDDAMVTNQGNVDVVVISDKNIPIANGIKYNKVIKMTTV